MAAVLWTARLYEEKFSRCLFNIVLHLTYWAGLGMTGPVSSIIITEEKDTARSHPNLADTLPKQKKVGSWTFPQQLKFRHALLNVLHILDHLATLLYEPQHVTVHHCVVNMSVLFSLPFLELLQKGQQMVLLIVVLVIENVRLRACTKTETILTNTIQFLFESYPILM